MSFTTETRFRVVLFLAVLLSLGGILIAAYVTKDAQDGGRGGALAVALSFVILFLTRGYGTQVYEILTKEAPEMQKNLSILKGGSESERVEITTDQKVEALRNKIRIDTSVQEIQNVYLAWSSAIGTLVWGFGDIITKWLL